MEEYIAEQVGVLSNLRVWNYMSKEEQGVIYNCQSEISVDNYAKSMRNKYLDRVYADYEKEGIIESDINEDIKTSDLPKAVKAILLRNHIHNTDEFLDVVMDKGWNSIRGMGESSAKIAIHWALPNEDLNKLVKNYKNGARKEF